MKVKFQVSPIVFFTNKTITSNTQINFVNMFYFPTTVRTCFIFQQLTVNMFHFPTTECEHVSFSNNTLQTCFIFQQQTVNMFHFLTIECEHVLSPITDCEHAANMFHFPTTDCHHVLFINNRL